jgi:hypothetical protein
MTQKYTILMQRTPKGDFLEFAQIFDHHFRFKHAHQQETE